MDTAQIALTVGIVSLITTIFFAILNYRTAKRTSDLAASTHARSIERSDVVWDAHLSDAGYLVLQNAGSDPAHDVRIKYWVMTPREPDDLGLRPYGIRSDNAIDMETFAGTYGHKKSKKFLAAGQAVGLPIPPVMLQSPYGHGNTGQRFGLRLQLEWFTEHGNHKKENLFAEDLGVVYSGFVFREIKTLPVEHYSTVEEALDPVLTPSDIPHDDSTTTTTTTTAVTSSGRPRGALATVAAKLRAAISRLKGKE